MFLLFWKSSYHFFLILIHYKLWYHLLWIFCYHFWTQYTLFSTDFSFIYKFCVNATNFPYKMPYRNLGRLFLVQIIFLHWKYGGLKLTKPWVKSLFSGIHDSYVGWYFTFDQPTLPWENPSGLIITLIGRFLAHHFSQFGCFSPTVSSKKIYSGWFFWFLAHHFT